ncbi:ABC transporter substrate-binding protein [Bradyrhizobium sp. 182]|uniref:ABC transporter substrate-binding protein n=1 Tax=unclassified Bradyrhizobium TaxID=2631580 RepID=UPI001FF988C3|nr:MULTISPECIES: ABC transporter substrate-binding protein [unclassified Bradyrhizobium]MCK1423380.1 ABC transporter substrate-binding protein [Bradyrhizobium sp. CW12]MCK1527764.1 ABC transporter substrate-binding protein [Bradyrhizobium sp. 182]MCK1597361.1 ABC transporter substrate-binding protein [Bradyrhizobium sp. 164]MCK1616646.1 ABC transporter substrate-binding protein [Bradyrhizobium sp. 159]MCK1645937.1 ABC transporter substrate-binding protein [Bradyrhizobium sp. 154]
MMKQLQSGFAAIALIAAITLAGSPAKAQQKSEIALSRQPGIFYMPSHIMEKLKLIEKHAASLGVSGVTTKWITFSGGGAQTDALLAGGVDILNTGTGNLLLLWDRTRSGVKGIVATSAQPMTLISRDANIKSIKDFGPGDKIAVPTVKVSTQAIVLQIAAAEAFGADQWSKLDASTVQLGHPDAYAALSNPKHEVHNHFSIPPFTFLELKNVPGTHVVLSSPDVMGGPLSQAQFFTTTKFADANPKIIQAVRDATKEAQDLIRSDTKQAVEIYKEITGDKTSVEELLDLLKEPGMMEWNLEPQGTMKFAAHLYKTGTLKNQPKAWTDYYLPVAHDLKGN